MLPVSYESVAALLVEAVVDGDVVLPGSGDDVEEVGDRIGGLEGGGDELVEFARRMEAVVVGACKDDCCVRRHDELSVIERSTGERIVEGEERELVSWVRICGGI